MKKIIFFAAVMGVAFTSCMNEEFIGDNSPTTSQGTPGAISFKYDLAKVTREDKAAAAAAEDLGYQFIVWGEKGEAASGAVHTADDGGANTHQLVFENYQVNYVTSSEMTTTSNTEGWEYVGYTHSANYQTNITTKDGSSAAVNAPSAAQTIKYWDWGASSYTFTAISASKKDGSDNTDIENGNVTIQKNTSGTTVYDKGYTLALTAAADLDHLFFSERVFIDRTVSPNASNTNRTLDNTYGGNVTFRFHSMSTKVRVAMYETIPGYSVTINSFKVADAADPAFSAMTTPEESQFKANFVNNAAGTKGNLVVKYISSGDTENHPTVTFTPRKADDTGDADPANILVLGNGLKKDVTLGTTITGATYDKAEKAYTSVFPKEDNTQNLKLKVCYTLTAVDNSGNATTGETITVTDATAEIPAEYLRWKPGYAYTYIFKISPNGNGQTGEGTTPAGLYPITFDAIEMLAEDGKAEYITTVSEPSITTFGVSAGKYVTGGSEYAAGSDIYATFMEGSNVMTPILGTSGAQHVNVYKVTTPDATNFPITEASVAEALAKPASITNPVYTRAITYTPVASADALTEGTIYYKSDGSHNPGEDGYVETEAVENTDYTITPSKVINNTVYTRGFTYTPVASEADLTVGTTYYKSDGSHNPGTTGYVETVAVAGTDYQVAPKITATDITTSTSTDYFTGGTAPAVATSVPGEDGNAISIAYNLTSKPTDWNALANVYYTDKACTIPANGAWGTGDGEYTSGTYYKKFVSAVKLSSVAAGIYAIEYEASAAWTGTYTKVYKVIVVQ